MKSAELKRALAVAVIAARAAGKMIRQNWRAKKKINASLRHDLKLELDLRCQRLIERRLRAAFPALAILGEEGVIGDSQSPWRWVVDPIDGTVNYAFGIPHACVSIALQRRTARRKQKLATDTVAFETVLGVIFDPFCDEIWTAIRGQPARLNGRIIRVNHHTQLRESIVSIGFAKYDVSLQTMLPSFNNLVHRVLKLRIMGSAALDLAYVACGRFDAYVECGVSLWDIAAGGLIVECAGGEFWRRPILGEHKYHVIANNGHLRRQLERCARA